MLRQASPSPVSQRLRRLGLTPPCFGCSCCVVSATLPPSSRFCRCVLLLDPLGHHRAACGGAGVLGRRARVCREAGARITTNVMVRGLDLVPQERVDGRRLEVVADRLALFHGTQLAVDATMVAPLKRWHTPTWQRRCRWSCSGARPTTQGTSVPRVDGSPRESPTRGFGLRDGRSVVFGNSVFLAPSCKGEDTPRTATSAHQRQVGMGCSGGARFCRAVVLD